MRGLRSSILLLAMVAQGAPLTWPARPQELVGMFQAQPRGGARSGTMVARKLSHGDQVVQYRLGLQGSTLLWMDWFSEIGARDQNIPEEAFWSILDGLSGNEEWTETDPDALPKDFTKQMEAVPAQGFVCHSCDPNLAAATWVSNGITRLRVAPLGKARAARIGSPGLADGISSDGLRSLARQRSLTIVSSNPCRKSKGDCSLELGGPKGQKWVFTRSEGKSSFDRMEAVWQNGPWWSKEWNWDSLRRADPREFPELVANWIAADADYSARTLLGPVEPVLSFPVSAWIDRSLPGMALDRLPDSVARSPYPPASVEFVRGAHLRAGADAMGRRRVELLP